MELRYLYFCEAFTVPGEFSLWRYDSLRIIPVTCWVVELPQEEVIVSEEKSVSVSPPMIFSGWNRVTDEALTQLLDASTPPEKLVEEEPCPEAPVPDPEKPKE